MRPHSGPALDCAFVGEVMRRDKSNIRWAHRDVAASVQVCSCTQNLQAPERTELRRSLHISLLSRALRRFHTAEIMLSIGQSTPKKKKKKTSKHKKEPTPPRERSLRACTRCRQRKQKCDNALPNCSNCVKGGVPCEAFPVNVVSRDNLLEIYDRLQESKRYNADLQSELCMVRLVVPDTLALFSAVIAQQVR